jgi:Tetratricopeptide repeat
MSKATINRFLMLLSSRSEVEQARLYQLIQAAERCYCLRNVKGQYEFGSALKLFHHPFDIIGEYYQAAYLYLEGQKDTALGILDTVREQAPHPYKEKSLLTTGGIHEREGDIDEAMKVRLVAAKSDTLSIALDAALGIAALLGMQGKHDKSVEYLESVLPQASKLGSAPLRFDLWNSYATELAEQGKTEEAMKIIIPVINSPYVQYHPNWLETQKEIKEIAEKSKRRSIIAFEKPFEEPAQQPKAKILAFPIQEPEEQEEEQQDEPEPQQQAQAKPSFSINKYLFGEFNLREKVDDWIHGETKADDLATLAIALEECKDQFEKDMIIGQLVDAVFPYSPEAKEAKDKWFDRVRSRFKEATQD